MEIKLTLDEVSQEFDLENMFGVDLSDEFELQENISQALIDVILERTEDGKDLNGRSLKRYSKDYVGSDEFKAFGKSPRDVDMELTGSMMRDLSILDSSPGKVKIGFRDDTETKKAFNHNTGDTVPKREFFGVNAKELRGVVERFALDIERIKKSRETAQEDISASSLSSLKATLGQLRKFTGQSRTSQNNLISDLLGSSIVRLGDLFDD